MQCSAAWSCRGFAAVAHNPELDIIAVTYGNRNCNSPFDWQVYSFLKGAQLMARLRDEGIFEGTLVFESPHGKVVEILSQAGGFEILPTENKHCDSDDDHSDDDGNKDVVVEEKCVTLVGDEVMTHLPQDFINEILEKDNVRDSWPDWIQAHCSQIYSNSLVFSMFSYIFEELRT